MANDGNLPPWRGSVRRHSCHKVRLHSYSDGSRTGARLAVACPSPVRAAEDWLEPRDTEQQGEKENQTWITAPGRAPCVYTVPRAARRGRTSPVRVLDYARVDVPVFLLIFFFNPFPFEILTFISLDETPGLHQGCEMQMF